jgi:SAM-dependent methyltransferase
MLIEYIPTTEYFSHFINWSTEHTILDFGSNCGNLLKSNNIITSAQYTGIDVDRESIEEGKRVYPAADWIWYNRFNPAYNHTGTTALPQFNKKFDMIISYSVFSHTTAEDMLELIDHLFTYLKNNGKIYFTYCNIDNKKLVSWFRNRRENCDEIPTDKDYVYLVDNKISNGYPSEKCTHFVSFYKKEWITSLLHRYNPVSCLAPDPNWQQDCMILTKKE